MKHTAGKWKVEKFVKVYAGEPHQPIMIVSNGEDIIADVHNEKFAALIASAPELLAACKMALNGGVDYDLTWSEVCDTLRAAIEAAERGMT